MKGRLGTGCLPFAGAAAIPPRLQGPGSGTGVADIFDEINEDLRAERLRGFAVRYGWLVAVVLVLVLGAVGGVQLWRWWQDRIAGEAAVSFSQALRDSNGAGVGNTMAATELQNFLATAPGGYRTLARFRLAALMADNNDLKGAAALWDEIANDTAVDADLRGLANLLWVQRQADNGDPAALSARLQPLADPNNTWHALAQELQAELAMRANDPGRATTLLTRLVTDATAPDDVRQRAGLLLALIGAPVPEPAK